MRTQSSRGRAFAAAAIVVAGTLVLAGAFFVGYVGELQRELNDPGPSDARVAHHVAELEAALGYDGFLEAYRLYRLTGDATPRLEMTRRAAEASRSLEAIGAIYAADASAAHALREARAVSDTFAHIAGTAPAAGTLALRGSAAMESLATLPQSHQLEAAYLSLSNTLDRVLGADRDRRRGGVAAALNWTQMLFIATLAALVLVILAVAGLLHFGIIGRKKPIAEALRAPLGDDMLAGEQSRLRNAVSDLQGIAARLTQAAPASSAPAVDLTRQLQAEIKDLCDDVGDMAVRMAEEPILANAGAPVFEATAATKNEVPARATRTLADVPGAEVLARLKDLAAEMNAAGDESGKAALKGALEELAHEVKTLAADTTPARLDAVVETLDDHADTIEAHAAELAAAGVEAELRAIATALRTLVTDAQKRGGDSVRLRAQAAALGERAESLFARLDGAPPARPGAAPQPPEMSIRTAVADITALARSIAELETRAERLSRAAVTARFSQLADGLSPAETADDGHAVECTTEGAIRALFESIERLTNVAAALARAGDAERQRRVAH